MLTLDRVPQIFDKGGKFLRDVGVRGRGPGEFQSPVGAFLVPGDSVVVLDQMNMRATVIGPDLRARREASFPWFVPAGNQAASAVEWPTGVFVSSQMRTPDGAGWALHNITFAGREARIMNSFGPGDGSARAEHPMQKLQRMAPAKVGGVWASAMTEYTISRWTSAATRAVTLERRPRWFAAESQVRGYRPDVPPPSLLQGLDEDAAGFLWIAVRVPAPNWSLAWKSGVAAGQSAYRADQFDAGKLWQTVVEVIDPSASRVIRRVQLKGVAVAMLSDRRLVLYDERANGEPTIEIIRLALRRP
jgi:hypothetical protein